MLGVRRATVQQKFLLITSNIVRDCRVKQKKIKILRFVGGGGGEAQIQFYIGGLIIFVRDCRVKQKKIKILRSVGKCIENGR